jgi:hypothetical protein
MLDEEEGWLNEGMSEPGRQAHQRECSWRKEAGGEKCRKMIKSYKIP